MNWLDTFPLGFIEANTIIAFSISKDFPLLEIFIKKSDVLLSN
jgi:hypothetical protein